MNAQDQTIVNSFSNWDSKTNNKKGYKSPNKGHKKNPKRSPQRRTNVVNDNPVSPSLGDANAFNLLLEKHSNIIFLCFICRGNFNIVINFSCFDKLTEKN